MKWIATKIKSCSTTSAIHTAMIIADLIKLDWLNTAEGLKQEFEQRADKIKVKKSLVNLNHSFKVKVIDDYSAEIWKHGSQKGFDYIMYRLVFV